MTNKHCICLFLFFCNLIIYGCIIIDNIDKIVEWEKYRDVDNLISSMKDTSKDAYYRKSAANALGNLGDPKAIHDLMYAFKYDKEVGPTSALALTKIKDKDYLDNMLYLFRRYDLADPFSRISDSIFDTIVISLKDVSCKSSKREHKIICYLLDNDFNKIDSSSIDFASDIVSSSLYTVSRYPYVLIAQGNSRSISLLIPALGIYGNELMANTLLNCGNFKLETAAREWAKNNQYRITESIGGGIKWGQRRLK